MYHLGNPLFLGRNKSESFNFLKKKVQDRLEGWMAKTISKVGRSTLIKAVVQSIPLYAMSTFKLPKTFCQGLDKMAPKFCWKGAGGNERYLASVSWDSLCRPRKNGGLGFHKFENINQALLAKVGWKLASKPDHL